MLSVAINPLWCLAGHIWTSNLQPLALIVLKLGMIKVAVLNIIWDEAASFWISRKIMFFSAFCEKGPFLNLKILHNIRYIPDLSYVVIVVLTLNRSSYQVYTSTLPKRHQRNTQTECRVYSLIFRVANVFRLFVVDKVYWYNLHLYLVFMMSSVNTLLSKTTGKINNRQLRPGLSVRHFCPLWSAIYFGRNGTVYQLNVHTRGIRREIRTRVLDDVECEGVPLYIPR